MPDVKTIKFSGGNYATITTWEAWAQGAFVSTPDEYIAECYGDFVGGLVDAWDIRDWGATDATNHATIRVPDAERYDPTTGAGFFQDGGTPSISQPYTTIDGWAYDGGSNGLSQTNNLGTFGTIKNCFISGGPGSAAAFGIAQGCMPTLMENNIIMNNDTGGFAFGIVDSRNQTNAGVIRNNTFIHAFGGEAFRFVDTRTNTIPGDFINNVMYDVGNVDGNGFSNAGGVKTLTGVWENNATSDSTFVTTGVTFNNAPVNSQFLLVAADFEGAPTDATEKEWKPANPGKLYETGKDLSGDGLTTDFEGNARTAPFDIGAWEVSTGATLTFSLSPDSGPLPAGLSVNPTTGNIEGTPTESGTFPNIIIRGSE